MIFQFAGVSVIVRGARCNCVATCAQLLANASSPSSWNLHAWYRQAITFFALPPSLADSWPIRGPGRFSAIRSFDAEVRLLHDHALLFPLAWCRLTDQMSWAARSHRTAAQGASRSQSRAYWQAMQRRDALRWPAQTDR